MPVAKESFTVVELDVQNAVHIAIGLGLSVQKSGCQMSVYTNL